MACVDAALIQAVLFTRCAVPPRSKEIVQQRLLVNGSSFFFSVFLKSNILYANERCSNGTCVKHLDLKLHGFIKGVRTMNF